MAHRPTTLPLRDSNRRPATAESGTGAAHSGVVPARVVIVGGGFGGLYTAKGLRGLKADITVIDRQNHHLFQPLLYQVATAGLSPAEIAWPIRHILSRQQNCRVIMDEVIDFDRERRLVRLRDGEPVPYDCLVLATGARHSYFAHDEWERLAPGLKSLDDATLMRRRILLAFERAEMARDRAERERWLTFVIVGGGPTGVELAGALAELARQALAADFRAINPRLARILLVEGGARVLPAMPAELSAFAARTLSETGVEVHTATLVTSIEQSGIQVREEDGSTQSIPSATVLWAAGNAASPVGRWLAVDTDRAGRIAVSDTLTAPGCDNVFVVGDAALVHDRNGKPLPGIAPVARQQGKYVARVIGARIRQRAAPAPFRYLDTGLWATIGRNAAVISWGRWRIKGRLAWWLWGLIHVLFLMAMRDRLIVTIRWLWAYITFGRGARLITGDLGEHAAPKRVAEQERSATADVDEG